MLTISALLIVLVIVIAIYVLVRPGAAYPALAVAVLLLGLLAAFSHFGNSLR